MLRYTTILLFMWNVLSGQQDTVLHLEAITISDNAIKKENIGSSNISWQTENLGIIELQSLSNLLQGVDNLYIKNYGPGSLATTTMRGGTASHTTFLWNGLPIQNPMVGQLDISLLNLSNFNSISIQRGANSSTWGSGTIAGAIHLDNRMSGIIGIESETTLSVGSYDFLHLDQSIDYGTKHFQSRTRYSTNQSQNNFPFNVANRMDTLTNAYYSIHTIHQDFYLPLNHQSQLTLLYWGTFAERQIPPLTTQSRSEASQDDRSHRLSLQYFTRHSYFTLRSKLAYFDEHVRYIDNSINLNAPSYFKTYIAEVNGEMKEGPLHSYSLSLSHITYAADAVNNYSETVTQNRAALVANWIYSQNKIRLSTSARVEMVDRKVNEPVLNIGLEYKIFKNTSLLSKINKFYRLPGLNDLYWRPGGNENLLAESGWSYESGIDYRHHKKSIKLNISLNAFSRKMHNFILWTPGDNSFIWSPRNISQVWSRGLELRAGMDKTFNKQHVAISGGLDYIRSSSDENIATPNITKGKQLWYTPQFPAFINFKTTIGQTTLSYNHRYTSFVHGFNKDLNAYHIGNINFEFMAKHRGYELTYFLNVQNVWNNNYRVIEARPMPGRNHQVGIKLKIK